jgi:GR25 family glycosyltransferase involved in LPS biosynthesis
MGNQIGFNEINYSNPPLLLSKPCFCTHAYLITNNGARFLLDIAKKSKNQENEYSGITPIDCMIIEEMKSPTTSFKWTCWINPEKPDTSSNKDTRNTGIVFQDTLIDSIIHEN